MEHWTASPSARAMQAHCSFPRPRVICPCHVSPRSLLPLRTSHTSLHSSFLTPRLAHRSEAQRLCSTHSHSRSRIRQRRQVTAMAAKGAALQCLCFCWHHIYMHVVKGGATVTGYIKLALQAGKANPSPPVGPALGSKVSCCEALQAIKCIFP